ncbi:type I-F CRISPR-associated endoribonuclease Cas6/Csy4 [Zooshikella ganghwensis]|uniref:Type I-F CRISPR-associated endoribonuclease Cas6/Csy4 n=1 Tax=Zooshikella ganghwensis TaxID=202772 RepID=A0A4P9VH75_9GAMM|nr:type I-F CRISPR-associated endoribonuclease Cas6/Csy4 [Zooshikella ganghwensis]RDH41816.1 type I-F CRISPR-associated endoribonuclease Cas6/Csy4 [Zooshikella ganghwensis]
MFYADITIPYTPNRDSPARVFYALNARFKDAPKTYALALPNYGQRNARGIFRVFAKQLESLVALNLANDPVGPLCDFKMPVPVAQDYAGPWCVYRRYRVPPRGRKNRIQRLAYAFEHNLPRFVLHSQSNQQVFCVSVEKMPVEEGQLGEINTCNFGLSTTEQVTVLPDL